MKKTKTQEPPKPTKPVQQALIITWGIWLLVVLMAYPLAVFVATAASFWAGVGVQLLGLIPALLCTPAVLRGNSPYALMWVSMVALVYLGIAGVLALLRIYEQAPTAVWIVQVVEAVLLLLINGQLFVLLKRLPALHRQNEN
ncbi:hypothetical protein ACFBZI_00855 [Moraxella sp. ZJ142]|uniref:hypothetical protein n=1 Tax=Moraxella marmotae TaxID=3344520 RepID=UPI0035D457E0